MNSVPAEDIDQQLRAMNEALLVSSVKQHELTEQAQKAELRYRRLFETATDGILIVDLYTGKIIDANPFASELMGYSHSYFLGKELWEIGLFGDKPANANHVRELREKSCVHYEDIPLKTLQGELEVEVVAIAYREDQLGTAQYNIRDITARRKSEQALAKALAYGDDIIATLREPFLVLDSDLRIKSANRSFYDSFRVSKQETEKRHLYDLGNGQWDIPELRELLNLVLTHSESIYDYEVEHSFPTLGRKIMLLNARPFPPDSKHPELILLGVYDISALRAQTAALADLHIRKDEFLAMLSHELRNPLAPIQNAVYLLGLQEGETQLQHQARGIIERQVTQLTRLVDDLMEVSRITTGRIQLRHDLIAINVIVEGAVEAVHPMMSQRGHELTVSLPPEPIWLNADGPRLQQVVVNLLTNAAKYTEDGGHIWLAVAQESGECVVQIRDTGVGIDPELLPHIFELFTQADRSLDRSQGGLGIGLALVDRIVKLHGGRVEATSAAGEGTEIVVHLPSLADMETKPLQPQKEAPLQKGAQIRVLVVDDNRDTADSLALLLTASGHDARQAHDGSAALDVALKFRPQVVLLDIGLPSLDGYAVARELRLKLGNVVLIAMTGYGQQSDRQHSLEAGFDHHFVKPVDFEKVLEIVTTISNYLP